MLRPLIFLTIFLVIASSVYNFVTNRKYTKNGLVTETDSAPHLIAQLTYTSSSANNSKILPAQTFAVKIGEIIHLKDVARKYDAGINYSFKVIAINDTEVVLKQVPDETGTMNQNYSDKNEGTLLVLKNTPVSVGIPRTGGGPLWKLWIK
ncbi:MAG: hypothetical protein HZA35_01410 [Parcubacteria group bacterium]|nr:hypothetical protein [Parcubacteria group bacterium]